MSLTYLYLVLIALTVGGFYMGRSRAISLADGHIRSLHSRPNYYGYFVAIWCGIPALVVSVLWITMEQGIIQSLVLSDLPREVRNQDDSALSLVISDITNLATGNIPSRQDQPWLDEAAARYANLSQISLMAKSVVVLCLAIGGIAWGTKVIHKDMGTRVCVERVIRIILFLCSAVAILTTIGIVLSLLFESIRFFGKVSPVDFLFGLEWSPQTALREDQVGSTVKPTLEILAGIPTVVYGFFAALTVAPFFRELGATGGFVIASESALAAGVVMGIMIIPFVSSLSDDVIKAVPQAMREGSYGLGATQSETIRQVIIPAALPGIVGSLLLAASRAIGETMIVVMAAGLSANLTANPFEAVTTVTVQIVTLLVGDQEFDSAKTLAAFALGLMLFFVTLFLNVIALAVVNKYREQYE